MTTLLRILITSLWLVAGVALAQGEPGAQAPGSHDPGHAAKPTLEMKKSEFFITQFEHLEPHAVFSPEISPDPEVNKWVTFYDVNLFQLIALGLMLLVFGAVGMSFRSGNNSWIVRVFRGWCHWLRDEVVYKVMGEEEGQKFAPFFIYLFFFIAFLNLLGLIPGSVTATATLFVTGAMALVTFAMMLFFGMKEHGVGGFFKNLLPHGLPAALIPLMAVVELIGLFIKPFALMVRLFANMLAGHLLIYSFVGMIFIFAQLLKMSGFSYGTALLGVGMGWFISIIEAFVVLLQAYIFTYLSVLFVQQSLHPAH